MNNLLNITTNQLTMSSREIAELCNKRHDNVIRICRELKDKAISPQIEVSEYLDSTGRKLVEFKLNKRDSLVLVARLSPEFTAKVVDRWQELENQNAYKAPSNLKEALLLAYKQQEQLEEQQKLIEEAKPKVLFANAVETSKNSILIGELAKLLKQNNIDIGQKRLFDWLRENEYIHKNKNIPTQKSMNLQLFEVKEIVITKPDGSILTYFTPKVTGKGQTYFINKFLQSNNKQLAGVQQ